MAQRSPLPPLEVLQQHFEVVPVNDFQIDSGLIWIKPTFHAMKPGDVAGTLVRNWRQPHRLDWRVRFQYKGYLVSRVVYMLHHGVDPGELTVDHVDRNPLNNNIENLELATYSDQTLNQRINTRNTSGARGVSWSAGTKSWVVQIGVNNKLVRLGAFTCKIEAAKAYNDALLERSPARYESVKNNLAQVSCDCPQCR
jgi:hypothetical protein